MRLLFGTHVRTVQHFCYPPIWTYHRHREIVQMTGEGGLELCTGPAGACKAFSHWRQAAFLLSSPRSVVTGDTIELDVWVDLTYGVFCSLAN